MDKLTLKKRKSLEKRYTTFSITKMSIDRECLSSVRKRFTYQLSKGGVKEPEVRVKKIRDNRTNFEYFRFSVRGSMLVEDELVKYYHSLRISLHWAKEIPNDNKNIKAL